MAIDVHTIEQLDDACFRRSLLTCNVCFNGWTDAHCRHHEDIIAGFRNGERLTDRIVVVGVNPQGTRDDPVYRQIEVPDAWESRQQLGDVVLNIYSGEVAVDPGWGWVPDDHQGLRTWFPFVQQRLGVRTKTELAGHFTFVELIKHTTANESELEKCCQTAPHIAPNCLVWLLAQLARHKPCMLIVTGNRGKKCVAPHLTHEDLDQGITSLHGKRCVAVVSGRMVDMYLSVAFSRTAQGAWARVTRREPTATRHKELLARIRSEIERRQGVYAG